METLVEAGGQRWPFEQNWHHLVGPLRVPWSPFGSPWVPLDPLDVPVESLWVPEAVVQLHGLIAYGPVAWTRCDR